ncbi:hypothetical protein JCM8547_006966 [Rhodosporidiobolus lusitaniae]
MQSYSPYSFNPPAGSAEDRDLALGYSSAAQPAQTSPYSHFGASSAMLVDGGSVPAYGDPLEAAYGPLAVLPLQQHQQQQQQQFQPQNYDDSQGVVSPTSMYSASPMAEYDTHRQSDTDQVEVDMLQASGLSSYDGMAGFAASGSYGAGASQPARSLSYNGFSGGEHYGVLDVGRPPMPRAETVPDPRNGANPFARLRAGNMSITPSHSPAAQQQQSRPKPRFDDSSFSGSLGPAPNSAYPTLQSLIPPPQLSSSSPFPSYDTSQPAYSQPTASKPAGKPPPPPVTSYPTAASQARSVAHKRGANSLSMNPSLLSNNPTAPSEPFDARAVGLPVPLPPAGTDSSSTSKTYSNIYSSSGFDLIGVLARVVNRKDPEIEIGAIDMSCSFVVVDAKKFDQPIVYASETFSKLTGYSNEEIVGRNCRFLQAPGDQQVIQGEQRRFSDGTAAHHLRRHIVAGKEAQVSLINYTKAGRPFINLVTCIPIAWERDSTEVDFIVGFQVDLIDQPAAILDKMHNGSYVVDYSRVMATINRNPPSVTSAAELVAAIANEYGDHAGHLAAATAQPKIAGPAEQAREEVQVDAVNEILDLVSSNPHGAAGLPNDTLRKQFGRLLVDQCNDLIHVVSLKGSLLYVSQSARKLLEYEPYELLGKPLSSFCHPSDIVSVQRELKDAGVQSQPVVNLIYRIRRKRSGYCWFEAQGRLHLEAGKGRKCVVLSGRPREVFRMSWRDLEHEGGMSSSPSSANEFFAKLCVDGIFLTTTKSAEQVLGIKAQDVTGKSVGDLSPPDTDDAQRVMDALLKSARGNATRVQHRLKGEGGRFVDVVTRFYPMRCEDAHEAPAQTATGGKSVSVVAQISLLSIEPEKQQKREAAAKLASSSVSSVTGSSAPTVATAATTACASSAGVAVSAPVVAAIVPGTGPPGLTSFSAVPSTFKSLVTPSVVSDNVFSELDVTRGTSWQFELHQMRLTNKKLREEREALETIRKKKAIATKMPAAPLASTAGQRACANCGRTSSAEWRSGPTGPKTLCNACGLRWAKQKTRLAAADKKRRDEEERAAQLAASVPSPTGSSSEAQTRSGSRDSGSGGDSTDPTTASPYNTCNESSGVDSPMAHYSHGPRPSLPHNPSSLYLSYGGAGGPLQPPPRHDSWSY